MPVQVDELQHIVQQLPAPAYEGLALQVLVLSRALPDKHDFRVWHTCPKDHVVPSVRQGAFLTGHTGLFQRSPIQHRHR